MRSSYTKDQMLLAVAKKKPRLQALVDGVASMTLEDIQALSEPLWVKEALDILRQSGGVGQKERIDQIVQRVAEAEEAAKAIPKPTFEVRLWDAAPEYVGAEYAEHSWKIQVDTGDVFLLLPDNKVRFGDSTIPVDEHHMFPLMQFSKLVGYMTLDQFKNFKQALLNQRHKL